jgi:hypothetical protein
MKEEKWTNECGRDNIQHCIILFPNYDIPVSQSIFLQISKIKKLTWWDSIFGGIAADEKELK